MALTLEDFIAALEYSRVQFLKHIAGIPEDIWDSKLIPDSKSVRETIQHLIANDRATMQSLETGKEPDYENIQVAETDTATLMNLLSETRAKVTAVFRGKFGTTPLDQEISLWGFPFKLGFGIMALASEDSYHSGQVAVLRTAMQPEWDYYSAVYG